MKNFVKIISLFLVIAMVAMTFVACSDGADGQNGVDGVNGVNGVDGKDGKDGKDGVDGKDGKDGINGKSAYEIAVENGFEGTVDQWLSSLNGEDGYDGAPGATGAKGDKGDQGVGIKNVILTKDEDEFIFTFTFTDGTTQSVTALTPVTSKDDLSSSIASGEKVILTEDITFNEDINNDATINLSGNTFEATGTIELGSDANLDMKDGDYVVNSTYGHVDVRPTTSEGSVVNFENVNFAFNKLSKTYGPSTNRLGSVVEVCASVADAHTEIVFKNCTFDNAQIVFEGMSDKTGSFNATFENCTFNALTSSAPIYVQNYVEGTIKVIGCTFNLVCTSSTASAISVSSSSSTAVTVTAENNVFNAVAATPYTFDETKGETEEYNVKVNGTPANIKFISIGGTTSTATETNTTKTGIAA